MRLSRRRCGAAGGQYFLSGLGVAGAGDDYGADEHGEFPGGVGSLVFGRTRDGLGEERDHALDAGAEGFFELAHAAADFRAQSDDGTTDAGMSHVAVRKVVGTVGGKRGRGRVLFEEGFEVGRALVKGGLQGSVNERLFGFEVAVEAALGEPGLGHDIRDAGPFDAALAE